MTIDELTEPLFQYVCLLNRTHRIGGVQEPSQGRAEIVAIFEEMKSKAASEPGLIAQLTRVELPLIFYVDAMLGGPNGPFAGTWQKLGAERGELTGLQKFFEMLEATLKERDKDSDECLKVYYTCIGLGFTGIHADEYQLLQRKMKEIQVRITNARQMNEIGTGRLCPEAYDGVDRRTLELPTKWPVIVMAMTVVGLLVVLLIANIVLYRQSTAELRDAVDAINSTKTPSNTR